MKNIRLILLGAGTVCAWSTPVNADAVTDWNATIVDISAKAPGPFGAPGPRTRTSAIAHLAIHDALNSIDARYDPYVDPPPAGPGASPEAAVAAAAYVTLAQLVPTEIVDLDNIYAQRIAALPPCDTEHPTCIADGIAAGEAAALAILALRTGDGSDTLSLPYTLPPGPGVYQPTPPIFAPPSFAGMALITPFAMKEGWQFRADPSEVLVLTSATYTTDYNEVKRVGAVDAEASGNRTSEQSEIARYWPGGGVDWNAIARLIVDERDLDVWENGQLFALLNMALIDSSISVFDTKYHYNFWRPITAIRAGDTDGNLSTEADPTWESFLGTPPYPDYTCGLTHNTGAAVEVLRRYFRTDALAYTFTVESLGITRTYENLSQAAAESVDARVFAGIHFRSGCVQGVRNGEQVGRFAIQHYLNPLK
jgi:hypothetical protein